MPDNSAYVVDVNLGTNGGLVQVRDQAALLNWLQREIEFWSWTNDKRIKSEATINNFANNVDRRLGELREAIEQFRFDEVAQSLQETFDTNGLPHSKSTIGRRIAELKSDPVLACAFALVSAPMFSHGGTIRAESVSQLSGAIEAILFRYGIDSRSAEFSLATLENNAEQHRRHLLELRSAHERLLSETEANYESLVENVKSAAKRQKSILKRLLGWAKRRRDTIDTDVRSLIEEGTAKLEATNAAYREHMRLKAPVTYWAEKSKTHKENERTYRNVMLGSAVALLIVSVVVLITVVEWASSLEGNMVFVVTAVGAIWMAVAFWIMRILVRLYLSEHHLAIDSAERATMAETYLALVAEKVADAQDREVLLSALFRPTADGIVKDDAPPEYTLAGQLSRLISGNK